LIFGQEVLERGDPLELVYLTRPDLCSQVVDLCSQRSHVPLDSRLKFLQRCDLICGQAEVGPVVEGQLDVLPEPRAEPVQTEADTSAPTLGEKGVSCPSEGQGEHDQKTTLHRGHGFSSPWFWTIPRKFNQVKD
jgi:hypothetical protein